MRHLFIRHYVPSMARRARSTRELKIYLNDNEYRKLDFIRNCEGLQDNAKTIRYLILTVAAALKREQDWM